MDRITADQTTLMYQANATAAVYLSGAVKSLDEIFGDNNFVNTDRKMELAIKLAKVAAMDYQSSMLGLLAEKIGDMKR